MYCLKGTGKIHCLEESNGKTKTAIRVNETAASQGMLSNHRQSAADMAEWQSHYLISS